MTDKSFDELMQGYVNNLLTDEELTHLLVLIQQQDNEGKLHKAIEQLLINQPDSDFVDQRRADVIFKKIMDVAANEEDILKENVFYPKKKPMLFTFIKFAVAASLIGVLVLGAYFWFHRNTEKDTVKREVKKQSPKKVMLAAQNKAVLILPDDATIVLNNASNGIVIQQGNIKAVNVNGKLTYSSDNGNGKTGLYSESLYNTVFTAKGGQYQIGLSDGSRVWLNSASSLHFTAFFAGKERKVEMTGEAYFEVVKNNAKPFIVSVNGAEIHVTGTHFNVMAYKDDAALKTTLFEGSVRFVNKSNSILLKPGQQLQMAKDGQIKVVSDVDKDGVLAWKNALFRFDGVSIQAVMKELSHWYDIEVIYSGKIKPGSFYGQFPRNTNLPEVLKILETNVGLKFKVEGRKVIVLQ